ncbi:rubrerythrin family protein [Magnetofaba australis]|uniref:Putative rubrerythrin n=1 Tax=Magnetofaba australis IT-1 TaxID=1434232 RepID=A0A1Y2K3P8_9PROT|nr:rubrerythrin family protein [Magnetofaba australis]OSM02552.1 putative rubrerythrin [Magnetofaba australis IT-1]
MSTEDNLKAAFAGESQANRKYLAFAKKAETDGFPQVAKLFRAVAEAETLHAHAHLRVLDGIKDTVTNLEEAMGGESYEFTDMYPGFVKEAEAEGNSRAVKSMSQAMEVEKVHYDLFSQALAAVKSGKDLDAALDIYICPVCGHTEIGKAPDNCPVCGVKGEKYLSIA